MKIALLDLLPEDSHHIYKDLAAGFGTKLIVGSSLRARFIEWSKRQFVRLPITSYGQLNAIFRAAGHEVLYVKNDLDLAAEADLVLTCTSLVDFHHEIEAIKKLKELGARVAVFGPVATLFPESYRDIADFVIVGEADAAAYELAHEGLKSWTDKNPMQSSGGDNGSEDGKNSGGGTATLPVTQTFSRTRRIESPVLKNLSDLPFPSWEGFPVETYSYFPSLKATPVLPVLGSRGCFAPCEYCAYRTNYKWRMRSPEHVVEELEMLKANYKIRGVLFRDPMFTGNNNRAVEIAELMIKKNLNLEWACETALEFLNEDLLDLLYRAGLRSINVGIESGSDDVLLNVQRRTVQQRQSEHLIRYCDKIGIRVSAFYCIGLPADTESSISETIEYAKRLNTHVATFNVFTPYPGTPLYERVKDEIFDTNWEHYTSFTPVHRHPTISAERLIELREKAFLDYYFRPQYIFSFLRRLLR